MVIWKFIKKLWCLEEEWSEFKSKIFLVVKYILFRILDSKTSRVYEEEDSQYVSLGVANTLNPL